MAEVIDIKTRKLIERIDTNEDTSATQFLKLIGKRAKENEVSSVFVLMINDENHVDWGMITKSEHHLLLAYASREDLKDEIRDEIFPVYDLELE